MEPLSRSPRILLVSTSHGGRSTVSRPSRALEIAAELSSRGDGVSHLLLIEQALSTTDEAALAVLADQGSVVRVATTNGGLLERIGRRLLPRRPFAARITREILLASRQVDLVVAVGSSLLDALPSCPAVPVVLDVPAVPSLLREACRRIGRDDAHADAHLVSPTPARLNRHGVKLCLAAAEVDRRTLRSEDLGVDIELAPLRPRGSFALHVPARPPSLLFVGSETVANLDAIRWFRRHVLPRIVELVPGARLRVVGESGRFTEPSHDVERIGWVNDLSRELRDAAVVVLPLRIGGRVRRRALDALASGRCLATTSAGAHGLPLVDGETAIVRDEPVALARSITEVLRSDGKRRQIEERALELARGPLSDPTPWDAVHASLRALVGREPIPGSPEIVATR